MNTSTEAVNSTVALGGELFASPVVWVILGCEIGFWVLVAAGLAARYVLHLRKVSSAILLAVPLVDLVLLAAVALDISRGAEVATAHRLAGIYLGVTVVFGHTTIKWADARFAYWFGGAQRPPRLPKSGPVALRNELVWFGQWLLAAGIAAGVVMVFSVTVADEQQARDLRGIFGMLGVVTVIWLLTGPVWAMFGAKDDPPGDASRYPTTRRATRVDSWWSPSSNGPRRNIEHHVVAPSSEQATKTHNNSHDG